MLESLDDFLWRLSEHTERGVLASEQQIAHTRQELAALRAELASAREVVKAFSDGNCNLANQLHASCAELAEAREVVCDFLSWGPAICECGHRACKSCRRTKDARQWIAKYDTARSSTGESILHSIHGCLTENHGKQVDLTK